MDDEVYVIYHNGQRLQESFSGHKIKIAYLTIGSANGVITTEAKYLARFRYEFGNGKKKRYDWWEIGRDKQQELLNEVKQEFEVVAYIPNFK